MVKSMDFSLAMKKYVSFTQTYQKSATIFYDFKNNMLCQIDTLHSNFAFNANSTHNIQILFRTKVIIRPGLAGTVPDFNICPGIRSFVPDCPDFFNINR